MSDQAQGLREFVAGLNSPKSDDVFRRAERNYLTVAETHIDILDGKPRGWCPSCGKSLLKASVPFCGCPWWRQEDTEDENRIRYVSERLEQDKIEVQMEREAARCGLEL